MGQLVDGVWVADDEAMRHSGGRFVRPQSSFRSWVSADGAAGPSGSGGFAAERALVRFDAVYVGHFKCNLRRLVDYPNLWDYTRALYQHPGIASTVNMAHIKRHYYESHTRVNPSGIVPIGPALDFEAPHSRG